MQWYVLRVASNKEVQVKDELIKKVKEQDLTDIIGRIEVPIDRIKRIRGSKQMVQTKPKYRGYVFMEMESTDDGRVPEKAWFMIKATSGVGDFIGTEGFPTAMRDTEVAKMLDEAEKESQRVVDEAKENLLQAYNEDKITFGDELAKVNPAYLAIERLFAPAPIKNLGK